MKNVGEIKDCYGCGVCSIICPKKIIEIDYNVNGFLEPKINDNEKCISCKLCLDVCSYIKEDPSLKDRRIRSYVGWSNNDKIRKDRSTAGVVFELSSFLIGKGYSSLTVKYNEKKGAPEHFIVTDVDDLRNVSGSLYLQSNFAIALSKINKKGKYLVIGTPCQVDSARRYARKLKIEDSFYFIDFFCHGVPSKLMWDKYLDEKIKDPTKVKTVSWRNKKRGWHDSYVVSIEQEDEKYCSYLSDGDLFYRFFLNNVCLGKACYNKCKYKASASSADIRVGDMWGQKYSKNEKGVNSILAITEKGDKLLNELETCTIVSEDYESVIQGQMKKRTKRPIIYSLIMSSLKSDDSLQKTYNRWIKPYKLLKIPYRIYRKILNLIRHGY